MDILFNIFLVFFLVFMNGFFVAAEFAMVKVRKSRIETLVIEGDIKAKNTLKVVKDLNSYLSACQLGITLASLGLGWVGEPAVLKMIMPIFKLFNLSEITAHSIAFIIAFAIITGFHIVLGELAPKSLAILNAEKIALKTALPLILFYKISFPIMLLFIHSTNLILKIFGLTQVEEHEAAHTDEEIKLLVEESYKHGLIDQTELTFVDNIFNFSEKTVKDIMIPRTDMICISKDDSFDNIIKITMNEQFTRYPVYKENKDNIIGFMHIKDLYKFKIYEQENEENIVKSIRNILTVPESMSISTLFKMFQKEKEQMAIVIDEYGGTAGLITSEDILEEIVGEIQDEFDEENEKIQELEDGSYLVDGIVLLDEINELLDIEIREKDIDTIGGWLYSKIGVSPSVNQKARYNGYEFIVNKCSRKRILKVIIKDINDDEHNN